ncbi:MAG: hypothetical protein DMF61_22240 [Blastocatellia bacterium AA13]|nr:MAG: hypothetical protein DMF61_22240 [Blastocatellia bacterium AA13]
MEAVYQAHRFDALKMRYDDQVALLRSITELDLKLFTGYFTVQLLLGAWLTSHPLSRVLMQIGLLSIDLTLCLIASRLLYLSQKRRCEIVATIKNICEVLGFTQKDIYLSGSAINPEIVLRAWTPYYIVGVLVSSIGIGLIIFGGLA